MWFYCFYHYKSIIGKTIDPGPVVPNPYLRDVENVIKVLIKLRQINEDHDGRHPMKCAQDFFKNFLKNNL